jgi:hypothetical protein
VMGDEGRSMDPLVLCDQMLARDPSPARCGIR